MWQGELDYLNFKPESKWSSILPKALADFQTSNRPFTHVEYCFLGSYWSYILSNED